MRSTLRHGRSHHREIGFRGESTHGVAGEGKVPPRLVVVHPSNDEENWISSAGRKQRGSCNSLLLLEAHNLAGPGAIAGPRPHCHLTLCHCTRTHSPHPLNLTVCS